MQLSIAGRYLVYMPQGDGIGASRRLPDGERDRERKLLEKLHKGDGGYIVRTAAQGASQDDFEREIAYLHKLHEVLDRRAADVEAPALVFQEADLSIRVLRDVLGSEFDGAVIDDSEAARAGHLLLPAHRAGARRPRSSTTTARSPVRARRRRGGVPLDALAPGRPALGRLPDDRLRRGADRDRHQHGQLHRPGQGPARGHDHEGQRRGGRRGRAPAAAARHRRDHRHRLHRHGAREATATRS